MKNLFESEETFTAYATVLAGHYMLEQLLRRINKPKTPILLAIDKATRYDKKNELNYIEQAIVITEDIIAAKIVLEDKEGVKSDKKRLNELKDMKSKRLKL